MGIESLSRLSFCFSPFLSCSCKYRNMPLKFPPKLPELHYIKASQWATSWRTSITQGPPCLFFHYIVSCLHTQGSINTDTLRKKIKGVLFFLRGRDLETAAVNGRTTMMRSSSSSEEALPGSRSFTSCGSWEGWDGGKKAWVPGRKCTIGPRAGIQGRFAISRDIEPKVYNHSCACARCV